MANVRMVEKSREKGISPICDNWTYPLSGPPASRTKRLGALRKTRAKRRALGSRTGRLRQAGVGSEEP